MNFISKLQHFLDSEKGQTFMNYAYSWGASIVILGALFKLTHLPGANLMLFLGMGTEVIVFFIAGFERNYTGASDEETIATDAEGAEQATIVGGGGTIVINGSGASGSGSGASASGANAGGLTIGGGVAASNGPTTPAPAVSQDTAEAMELATTTYVDRLNELNDMLLKVAAQSERLTTDSQEMENLNRTLTGIAKVYEMQLKGASQQIGAIDEINAKTRKMVEQIEQLNVMYARMIEAMNNR